MILCTWTTTSLRNNFWGTLRFLSQSSIYIFHQHLVFSVMEEKSWVKLILFFCRYPIFIAKVITEFPFFNPGVESVSTLILDYAASSTVKKYICSLNHPVCGILLQQPEQTRRLHLRGVNSSGRAKCLIIGCIWRLRPWVTYEYMFLYTLCIYNKCAIFYKEKTYIPKSKGILTGAKVVLT